jgi:hypothetical protein
LGRFTRKTLSFSKVDYMHHLVTRWFIVEYNLFIQVCMTGMQRIDKLIFKASRKVDTSKCHAFMERTPRFFPL